MGGTRVSVFGLGYVGTVSCACLAQDGFDVIGVDVNPTKVALINAGASPIVEAQIDDLVAQAVAAGRLRATCDPHEGARAAGLITIAVGTPSRGNGAVDLGTVERVAGDIGAAIAARTDRPILVVRSTVLPGTTRKVVIPAVERASGKRFGAGFGVCFQPEFLREGSSVRDYYDPPFTLIGADDPADGARVAALYTTVRAEVRHCAIESAEMVKYVGNAFHALKVTFANEMGLMAQSLGVDSHEVMDIACADTKLNISPRYLRPGFAFGGSCLPKDLRALVHEARVRDLALPLLGAIAVSNQAQIARALDLVLGFGKRKVALLGLAFKAGTDDLRESPLVQLAEGMIGKGLQVAIYDRNVSVTRLVGANRAYVERQLPHLATLLTDDLAAAIASAEIVIVGNGTPELAELPALCREGQVVVDLVRIENLRTCARIDYHGIAW